MNTIPELLQNSVHNNSKKTAVISNEEEYSYKEIDDLVICFVCYDQFLRFKLL